MGNTPINSKINIYQLCNLTNDNLDNRDMEIIINEDLENYQYAELVDLRTNIDIMPIYQVSNIGIGCSAVSSIASIIYNTFILKGTSSLFIPSRAFMYYTSIWKFRQLNELNIYNILQDKLSLRDYLKGLKKFGICDDKKYIWIYDTFKKHPSEECFNEGQLFKIDYFSVPKDLNTIKYLLQNDKMLLISLSVFSSFLEKEVQMSGKIKNCSEIDSFIGLISAVLVGYIEKEKCFIVRFSLGKYWGDRGYGYLKYNDLITLVNNIWYLDININININQTSYWEPIKKKDIIPRRKYVLGGSMG